MTYHTNRLLGIVGGAVALGLVLVLVASTIIL